MEAVIKALEGIEMSAQDKPLVVLILRFRPIFFFANLILLRS